MSDSPRSSSGIGLSERPDVRSCLECLCTQARRNHRRERLLSPTALRRYGTFLPSTTSAFRFSQSLLTCIPLACVHVFPSALKHFGYVRLCFKMFRRADPRPLLELRLHRTLLPISRQIALAFRPTDRCAMRTVRIERTGEERQLVRWDRQDQPRPCRLNAAL